MSSFSRFRRAPPPSAPENIATSAFVPGAPDSALLAAEEETLRAAITAGDSHTMARLVIEGASTKTRQRAAEGIDDPVQIGKLIRGARGGNDKNVYKILTRKRDALLAHEREIEQLHAEISAVSAAMQRHSRRPYDPLFTIAQETQQAVDRSLEAIAQRLRQIAAEAAHELAAANAAVAQRQREQEAQTAAVAAAPTQRR